jgi:Flp pilus assembly protein TadD
VLHGYVSLLGDTLRLKAELEDPSRGGVVESAEASGPAQAGILPLAESVARSLDPSARPPLTRSEKALQSFIEAQESRDPGAALAAIERAVAADPDCAPAYLFWMRLALARQDRALAAKIVAAVRARGEAVSAADRARLEAESAALASDPVAQAGALSALAAAAPADPAALRAAADAQSRLGNFTAAASLYERAVSLQPGDAILLNALGYAHGLAGNVAAAEQALRRYENVRPNEANPLDSLGEVYFYNGHFAQAAALFRQAYERNPSFNGGAALGKEAQARWLAGDRDAASKVLREYWTKQAAANDGFAGYRQAEWDYWTGDPKAAIERVTAFSRDAERAGRREAASLGYRAASFWHLDQGNRSQARQSAADGLRLAQGTNLAPLIGIAAFSSNPSASAAEWKARAARAFSDSRLDPYRAALLGYALLFDNHPAEAVDPLRRSVAQESPGPAAVTPFLLAWAEAASGQAGPAARTLRFTPILPFQTPSPVTPIVLRRLPALRATLPR